jgi:hypothetical protein
MALVAWSSEKIKTILGGFLFFRRTWLWQNKFIVKKNSIKAFILKINDFKKTDKFKSMISNVSVF